MTYQTPRVSNAAERSISIILPAPIWLALDGMAKNMNTSKAELARREIEKLVGARND